MLQEHQRINENMYQSQHKSNGSCTTCGSTDGITPPAFLKSQHTAAIMSADISVHQIEHIYYCQKDESVTMNFKETKPSKETNYPSVHQHANDKSTINYSCLQKHEGVVPLLSLLTISFPCNMEIGRVFVDRKRQVPSDVKLLLVLFKKSQALEFDRKIPRLDQSNPIQ